MSGGVILCDNSRWWSTELRLNRIVRSNFDRGLGHSSQNFLHECSEEKRHLSEHHRLVNHAIIGVS